MNRSKIIVCILVLYNICFISGVNASGVGGSNGGHIPINMGNPGAAGGISLTPGFRVGLISDTMKGENIYKEKDKKADKVEKLKRQLRNHYPSLNHYFRIGPKYKYVYEEGKYSTYDSLIDNRAIVGGYDNSLYDYYRVDGNAFTNRWIIYWDNESLVGNPDPRLFYNRPANIRINKPFSFLTMEEIAQEKWKLYLDQNMDQDYAKSVAVWRWMLKDYMNTDIVINNIKEYTKEIYIDNIDPEKRRIAMLSYIDLLITLYIIQPDEEEKKNIAREIARYAKGDETNSRPVVIGIDTLTRLSATNLNGKKLFIPSIDYIQYYYKASERADVTNQDLNLSGIPTTGRNLTQRIFEASAVQSMKEKKYNKRLSDNPDYDGNAFCWGFSGVMGGFLTTQPWNNPPTVYWGNSTIIGTMQWLEYNTGQYGFITVGGGHRMELPPEPDDIRGDIKTSPKNQEVDAETGVIETIVNGIGNFKQESPDNMKKYIESKLGNNFVLRQKLKISSDYDNSKIDVVGKTDVDSASNVFETNYVAVTKDSLYSLMDGLTSINFTDDLTGQEIEPKTSLKVTYTGELTIGLLENDNINTIEEYTFYFSVNKDTDEKILPSDFASFWRGEEPPPKKGYYVSKPTYWSEIKQGAPGHETFEAMAGTPTTRHLFFASGGSEFIVDIETEYKNDGTARRNYKSEFHSVDCEFKQEHQGVLHSSSISPDTTGLSTTPNPPTPRSIIGYDGTKHEETVSEKTETVIDSAEETDSEGNVTKAEVNHEEYYYELSGISQHTGCGPCHEHTVGGYTDQWGQDITFDYMKINKVQVWKLSESKVDGLYDLIGTDEVKATIVQGNPNIFYNIASSNTSAAGRLRYSLETGQHDSVYWSEGNSDNSHDNNITSGDVIENDKFKERRDTLTDVTAISDFLILQTSTGDQSVMYFEKTSPQKKTTESLEVEKTSKEEMWDNNSLSAAGWSEDEIHIGGYTGEYWKPTSKYTSSKTDNIGTIFDSLPAGLRRPSRPSGAFRLMKTNLDVIDTIPNGEYITGDASVLYELILDHGTDSIAYDQSAKSSYNGKKGDMRESTYSDYHTKINDIVIHNPVSAEYAMVESLADYRDQRTQHFKNIGGNLVKDREETEEVLDCVYPAHRSREHDASCYTEKTIENPSYVEPGAVNETFTVGSADMTQEYKAPRKGTYTLEVWGAAGGNGTGKGAYAKGTIELDKDDILYIHVGGAGESGSSNIDQNSYPKRGGFNGGGNGTGSAGAGGGGGTDIRFAGNEVSHRILVAGGGGGNTTGSVNQSYGRGVTSSNIYTLFQGGHACTSRHNDSYPNDEGGGGGGYYGGKVEHGDDPRWSYGGTSYAASTLKDITIIPGSGSMPNHDGSGTMVGNSGNGYAKISAPEVPSTEPEYITVSALACQEPHHQQGHSAECYKTVTKIIDANPVIIDAHGNQTEAGNFVNLDYEFYINFPNIGNFYGDGDWGIKETTKVPGKGYHNSMDTTEWTASKSVTFGFNVLYNDRVYLAGQEISLDVATRRFKFYCLLANSEAMSSEVIFRARAINASSFDGTSVNNKKRYSYRKNARHSAEREYNVDVVGRIGNLAIEDTGDFRFANLFKQTLSEVNGGDPSSWIVPNMIERVDLTKQDEVVGDKRDIRGELASGGTNYLNTYGGLPHLGNKMPITLPLSPDINNLQFLKRQPLRVGYNALVDIQTIGNYYDKLVVQPYYYQLNLSTGQIQPIDIYMKDGNEYKSIYRFNADGVNNMPEKNFDIYLNWDKEKGRRNFSSSEEDKTAQVKESYKREDREGNTLEIDTPRGNAYAFGTPQELNLTGRNRTFIGGQTTYNELKNIGGVIPQLNFYSQAQRWHFTYGLPSSAKFVPADQPFTEANIAEVSNNESVIIMAADITAVGGVYDLKYSNDIDQITVAGKDFDVSTIQYPVVLVYSSNKSARNDLTTKGTH